MKNLLLAALLTTTTTTQADYWLDVKLPNANTESSYVYKDVEKEFSDTYGIGASVALSEHFAWRGGVYNNKFGDISVYGLANIHTSSNNPLSFGINLGVESGSADVFKIIPHVTYYTGNFRFEVGYDALAGHKPSQQQIVLDEFKDVPVRDRDNSMYGRTPEYTNSPSVTFTIGYKF